jgi:exodeoxyribonuclease V gamma subunit
MQRADRAQSAVFKPTTILVQSPGMAQWLKIQVANALGIAANIEFPLPSSFIWQLYRQHIPALPEQSAFNKDAMAWKIMSLLPDLLLETEFAVLNRYLKDDDPLKYYQLSYKIADVFDQYLVYRPDWITTWEEGGNTIDDADVKDHPWQPILWRALVQYSNELQESPLHRANLHSELLQRLTESEGDNSSAIFVFGISAIPQQQLEVLSALALTRDVVIFWANPSAHYWGDLVDLKTLAKAQLSEKPEVSEAMDIGNPLLSSWGKLGRDYQDMLLTTDLQQHDEFVADPPSTLLEHVQYEILELTYRGSQTALAADELLSNGHVYPKILIDHSDHSFQVHLCHSKVRELEVLHDQLLGMFERDPSLSPGDVIVMMPDVASYAPFIDGVFAGANEQLSIPFAISDRSASQESAILQVFMQMMSLHQSRMGLSDVMSMFEIPAVLSKFDVSPNEFEMIKHWLQDAGVRWGWDKQDKQYWGLPEEPQNTWRFGLTRLIAGYAMDGSSLFDGAEDSIAPYRQIEGQSAIALGKFNLFGQQLEKTLRNCRATVSIESKVEFALDTIDKMFEPQEQEQNYINQLRQLLQKIATHTTHYSGDITQDMFVEQLTQGLDNSGVGQRFLAGFVNFCTLMPMRSIPFRVVCLLGMNDGDYPRQSVPMGFDLMKDSKARRGDRSRRLDDRYLFLEAIQAARHSLYVSYIGASIKDASELSPSILVSELLDYCGQCFMLENTFEDAAERDNDPAQSQKSLLQHLVCHHALQPFSQQYFAAASKITNSFQQNWLGIARKQYAEPELKPFMQGQLAEFSTSNDMTITDLQLEDLLDYFSNPAKAFIRQRWHTSLSVSIEDADDQEPFLFDPLDRYKLNQRIVASDSAVSPLQIKAEGDLPIGNAGRISFEKVQQQSQDIKNHLEKRCAGRAAQVIEIDQVFDDIRLVGWVNQFYSGDLILWRAGKIRAKFKLQLYLIWLSLCAKGVPAENNRARYIGLEGEFSIPFISQGFAEEQLTCFIEVWRKGQHSAIHFYPETSWQWVKTKDPRKTENTFMGNLFAEGEGQEQHIARFCPDLQANMNAFTEVSELLLTSLVEIGEGK